MNPTRLKREGGFTFVELLVVVLMIGILAAIAIPAFLSQTKKSHDASAMSNARNLATMVRDCETKEGDFRLCDTEAELGGTPGLEYGSGVNQVEVAAATANTFTVRAISKSETNGANHAFSYAQAASSAVNRTCTAGGGGDSEGACQAGAW